MKRILYIIYIMVATLAVMLFGGCEEQVFEYDFINNAGEELTPTPTPGVSANKVIYYTSTDGKKITEPAGITGLVSHTCENGQGAITYNHDIKLIPDEAFKGYKTLKSIKLPSSVTSIGDKTFYNCVNLTSITIPSSVTSIGDNAFESCTSLTSVTIPNGVTSIGNYAFDSCTKLTSITIPSSVTSIGDNAFDSCTSLTSVTIPNSVTSIGNYTFNNCKSLTSVTIPESVTEIGDYAFNSCTKLTSITIPSSVTSIGNRAFYYCTTLKRVDITDLEAWCKIEFSNSYANPIDNEADLYLNGSKLTELTIPNGITAIKPYTFSKCTSITSVTIPNSVTSIGSSAFRSCTSLTSVTIPNSVTEIGDVAFYKCSKLAEVYCKPTTPPTLGGSSVFDSNASDRKIYVPSASVDAYKTASNWSEYASQIVAEGSSTTEYVIEYTSTDGNMVTPYKTDVFGANIVSNVYQNGKGTITFDGPVTTIGAQAFYKCSTLASFTIPDSVTSIGNYAFGHCSGLTSVTIPNNITSIGGFAFEYCTSLTSVTIPESVTSIGSSAFYNCSALTSVTIPESVTEIGSYAFAECYGLTSVTIPNSVTEMGESPFRECTSLKSFYGKFASEDNRCLIINGELKSFAPAGLTSYIIPNSVTSIGDYAFYNCSALTSVTIPNGVTSIGNYTFCNCSKLAEVYCKPTTPPTLGGSGVFDNNATDRKIYVPSASVDAYKTATNWSEYASQIVAEGSSTTEYVIEYTSTDGAIVTPNTNADFGANIVSNVYENGKGVITFDGPVTKISSTSSASSASAFYGCNTLTSITIPESVTSIGNYAFYNCSALTSVTIPDSVTSIGYAAFYYCTKLTSVTIPTSVTEIGERAFSRCASLKNFYGKFASDDNRCLIVNGVLTAFAPAGLTSYIIPNGVTSIGNYAFGYCSGLTNVTFGNNVTSIGTYAFIYCSGLTSVTIPNSVTSIEYEAFYNCSSLTSVTIPNSVTSIGNYTFYNCSKLAEVYCKPKTPPTLGGSSVFDSNASDRKIYVPSASVDDYKAANYWSRYADQIVAEGSSTATNVIEYTSSDGNIVTPNSTADFGANIVSNVYENGKGKITFDGPVTKISNISTIHTVDESSFYDCKTLTSITIPDSVTSIRICQFVGCSSLKSFYGKFASEDNRCLIVNGVLTAFAPAGLTTYSIPENVTSINNHVFNSCTDLTSVTIPNSVTSMGYGAFVGCTSLKRVDITDLEAWCKIDFYSNNANPLNNGADLYLNGSKVTALTIPSSITEIKQYTFYGCPSLTSVTIPNSVTEIGETPFGRCTLLKSFYGKYASEDNRCLIVDGVLNTFAPAGLTTYSIPNSVTSIGDYVFYRCSSLTNVTIPESVTSIGNYAFYYCTSLTSVTIPNSVTSIGSSAFYGCSKLAEVYCKPTTPPTLGGVSVFYSNASGRKIYVPSASVDAYKTATNWSEYASQIVAE